MYSPNTPVEQQEMLARIGAGSLDDLFATIPAEFRMGQPLAIPPALTELELTQSMAGLGAKNRPAGSLASFLGAGCYDHFVPAVVDTIASRSEYYTAYTPYQAEASQGTLQVGFEYQTLVCQLTGMDVANASLYEGATALTEAALMARGATPEKKTLLVAESVHPEYRQTLATYVANLDAKIVTIPCPTGELTPEALAAHWTDDVSAVLVQSPNFFGRIEAVAKFAEQTQRAGATLVQAFDPISLGMLKRPADLGADIAVAEGQSLGTPMSFGGPFLGMFACREKFLRKIPGRLVGQTVDRRGNRCFTLTLQTREQHIRREKATSNICTNQGLLALRASVYLSLVGPAGLKEIADLCFHKAHYASTVLSKIPGVKVRFLGPFFKEFVLDLPVAADSVIRPLVDAGIHPGVPLARWFPAMQNSLLVAVTEKRTKAEIDNFADKLHRELAIR